MQPGRILCTTLLLATSLTPCIAMTRTKRGPTAHTKHTKATSPSKHISGQQTIDDARASQIQSALIKSGYMASPTGHWDSATESALQKYQSDNGWQTKLMPDSRAIIKLGLGPSSTPQADGALTTQAERNFAETPGSAQ